MRIYNQIRIEGVFFRMIKIIQVMYGYILLTSFILLIAKLISLKPLFVVLIIITVFIFFRIRSHPEDLNYPFAFEIRLLSR